MVNINFDEASNDMKVGRLLVLRTIEHVTYLRNQHCILCVFQSMTVLYCLFCALIHVLYLMRILSLFGIILQYYTNAER